MTKKIMFLFVGLSSLAAFLTACTPDEIYVYDLVLTNVGHDEASGVTLYFGKKEKTCGGLGARSAYSKTHSFFETEVPYPTRIEYCIGKVATAEGILSITEIKTVGQLKPNSPNQRLRVEIDSTNRTAVAKVEIVEGSKK